MGMTVEKSFSWVDRAESFARIRAQILKILAYYNKRMNMVEIGQKFIEWYRFLPRNMERRMRELVEKGYVEMYDGRITTYKIKQEEEI